MFAKMRIVLVAALAVGLAAPALADSVDGKPTQRTDQHSQASLRGSPSILFEDCGAQAWPLGADDGHVRSATCGDGAY
jgi:hypothetical protein